MILLSINGIFRTILILSAIYCFYKIIVEFVFPRIIKHYMEKHEQNFHPQSNKKDGKLNIDFVPKKDKPQKNIDGEYVDYEEVK